MLYENERVSFDFLDSKNKINPTFDKKEIHYLNGDKPYFVKNNNIFVGRDDYIFQLEQAIRNPKPLILLTGLAGIGKSASAHNFVEWLKDTNGLENDVIWIQFEDYISGKKIKCFKEVINFIYNNIVGEKKNKVNDESKVYKIGRLLNTKKHIIIFDNMQSLLGSKEAGIKPEYSESNITHVKKLFKLIKNHNSKIIITSRVLDNNYFKQHTYSYINLGIFLDGSDDINYLFHLIYVYHIKKNNYIDRLDLKSFSLMIKQSGGIPLLVYLFIKAHFIYKDGFLNKLKNKILFFSKLDLNESYHLKNIVNNISTLENKFKPFFPMLGMHGFYLYSENVSMLFVLCVKILKKHLDISVSKNFTKENGLDILLNKLNFFGLIKKDYNKYFQSILLLLCLRQEYLFSKNFTTSLLKKYVEFYMHLPFFYKKSNIQEILLNQYIYNNIQNAYEYSKILGEKESMKALAAILEQDMISSTSKKITLLNDQL